MVPALVLGGDTEAEPVRVDLLPHYRVLPFVLAFAAGVAAHLYEACFDWLDAPFDLKSIPPKEIEESFEDPFSLRLLPEGIEDDAKARFFNLGKTLGDRGDIADQRHRLALRQGDRDALHRRRRHWHPSQR